MFGRRKKEEAPVNDDWWKPEVMRKSIEEGQARDLEVQRRLRQVERKHWELEESLNIEPRCQICGGPADHHHGKHGCCGTQRCHMRLFLAHTAYGEDGVNQFMHRNWPSIWK